MLRCVIVAVSIGMIGTVLGAPFEPEISSSEGRLLESAMAIGQTNALAAAAVLDTGSRRGSAIAYTAGNFYFQAGDYAAARLAYEEAIEKFPNFRVAKIQLGRVALLQGDWAAVISLYQELVGAGHADADVYLLLGHALQNQKRTVSAETAFRNALLLSPEKKEALLGLTQELLVQERYQEALGLTREILAFDPHHREAWRLRANIFLMQEDYVAAIHSIEAAKRLGLADSELRALQGDLFLQQNQPGDAIEVYQQAFGWEDAMNRNPDRVLRAAEGFLLLGDGAGAEAMLAILAGLELSGPQRIDDLRIRARLHLLASESDQAEQQLLRLLELDPMDGEAMLLLADIALEAGREEAAVMHCERAARIPEYAVAALVQQAQIEVGRGAYERAIVLLESAQARRGQPHVARYLEQLRRMLRL